MTHAGPLSDREATILNAALHVFATYGLRRTTMDDIAQAAGLARTGLYQTYRNKEEIFRALSQACHAEAAFDMRLALAQPDLTLEAALMAAFIARDGKYAEVVLTTPHGYELLDAGFAPVQDLVLAGEAEMTDILTEWLTLQEVPAAIGAPSGLADTLMAALKGLRVSARTLAELRASEMRLAALIARALT